LSGKLPTTNTSTVSSLNSDFLFPLGSLGDVSISSLDFSIGLPLSCSMAVICNVPIVGDFYPPAISTPIVTPEGNMEPRLKYDFGVSSSMNFDEAVGKLVIYYDGHATDTKPTPSLSTSPLDLSGTFPHLCSKSTSSNSSSDGNRVHYSLRNRAILTEDYCVSGVEEIVRRGLGYLPRAPLSTRGQGKKSHLLLAQYRAIIDLASCRQSSIEWALREKQSHEVVSL
jgi:hypothetical protein